MLRLPPHNIAHATFMQPFQCDLPPQPQETHRTTHADTTTRCKTHRRNNSRMKRPQPQPPHRRGTFYRRLQPLHTEKHKVSCSSFLPNTKPRSIPSLLILLLCIVRLCFVMWSTTLHHSQFHRFLFFCYVLLDYVLLCDLPPFIIVNFMASYSFVMYC